MHLLRLHGDARRRLLEQGEEVGDEERRERALVVALGAIGTRGLYETTEGRFAEVAREMLEMTGGQNVEWA